MADDKTDTPAPRSTGQQLILWIGSIGPLGHCPASGTVTVAVVGVPLAYVLRSHLTTPMFVIVATIVTVIAVWIHDVGDRILGEKDSRKLVWDELVGYFWAVVLVPITWQVLIIAFFIERAIDIAKVPPANVIEKRVPGGLGVVGDDVVAGAYTLLLMLAAQHFGPTAMFLGAG